jgi:hypothetical protein
MKRGRPPGRGGAWDSPHADAARPSRGQDLIAPVDGSATAQSTPWSSWKRSEKIRALRPLLQRGRAVRHMPRL